MKKTIKQGMTRDTRVKKAKSSDYSTALSKATQSGLEVNFNLHPGLRDRIIAEMDGSKIPAEKRMQYLAALTGRALQTARRWIDEEKPGLPDLLSFALLCYRFDSDANWMLGLTHTRYPLPKLLGRIGAQDQVMPNEDADWASQIIGQVTDQAGNCELRYMSGDDMEPRIKDGAPIWVDTGIVEIKTNGVYLLEYQGRVLVRHVEIRIGEGFVLSCENTRYKSTSIKDANTAKKVGLRILGQIKLAITVEKF